MEIKINNDKKFFKQINNHCFCVLEKTDDTICPCKNFRESQKCICNIFSVKKEKEDIEEYVK